MGVPNAVCSLLAIWPSILHLEDHDHRRGRPAPDVEELTSLVWTVLAGALAAALLDLALSARPALSAKVAGAGVRIPLLRLGAVAGGVRAAPGILVLKDVNVRLTGTAADALNQTLRRGPFASHQRSAFSKNKKLKADRYQRSGRPVSRILL